MVETDLAAIQPPPILPVAGAVLVQLAEVQFLQQKLPGQVEAEQLLQLQVLQ